MTKETIFGQFVGDMIAMAIYTVALLLVKHYFGFEATVTIGIAIILTVTAKISSHIIIVPSKP